MSRGATLEWVMVVAAELKETESGVTTGTDTHQTCVAAAKLFASLRFRGTVCATAGYSERHKVDMGAGPMMQDLTALGIPAEKIAAGGATTFTTSGEMDALVRLMLIAAADTGIHNHRVHLVCKWWHLPRARKLLEKRLSDEPRLMTSIRSVPVFSLDILGMTREIVAYQYYKRRDWN